MSLRRLAAALACVASLSLCAFTPTDADLQGLSPLQKSFVTAPDWNLTCRTVLETMQQGIKTNAARAIVIAGCLYEEMAEPAWLENYGSRQAKERRMYANALLAGAYDAQTAAQSGKHTLNKDFIEIMEGIRGKMMTILKADADQAAKIEDLASRHLLDAMKSIR